MTPESSSWNPYSGHYARNEEAITDWEGNIVEERYRKLQRIDTALIEAISVTKYEEIVDNVIRQKEKEIETHLDPVNLPSGAQAEVASLAMKLTEKRDIANIRQLIGSMSSLVGNNDVFEPEMIADKIEHPDNGDKQHR